MLARSISQANVCLRCQFRLSLLPLRPRLRVSRRFLSAQAEDNDNGTPTEPFTIWDDLPPPSKHPLRRQSRLPLRRVYTKYNHDEIEKGYHIIPIHTTAPVNLEKRYQSSDPRIPRGPGLRRLMGRVWGGEFREHFKKLRIDVLGKPSDVIVLKDALLDLPSSPEIPVDVKQRQEHVDILERLEQERGLVQQSEVFKNIEEHKPEDPEEPLSEDDFNKLATRLQEGFTIRQLTQYIERQSKVQGLESELQTNAESGIPNDRPVISRSAWMPERSQTGEAFTENFMRGYEPEKLLYQGKSISALTQKRLLSLRVLRECWQIDVQEVVDSLGEVELKINPVYFELLLKGKKSSLEAISRRLDPNREEQIEAFRSRHAIRITATRDNAASLVMQVEDELSRVRQLDLNWHHLVPHKDGKMVRGSRKRVQKHLEEEIIDEISSITETEILLDDDGRLSIFCIDKKPGSGLSNRAHVAQRLVLDYFNKLDGGAESHLACNLAKPTPDFGVTRIETLSSLSWREKLQRWARWTAAMSKNSSDETHQHVVSSEEVGTSDIERSAAETESSSSFEHSSEPAKDITESDGIWSRALTIESSIQLGRVLHGWQSDSSFAQLREQGLDSNGIRTFSSEVQGLSRFLARQKIDADSKTVSLRMRFIPSPLQENVINAPNTFPPIEIDLDVDEDTHGLSLAGIKAIKRNVITDVMLPERTMDLRFQQRNLAYLQTEDDDLIPSIANFLDSSALDLKRDQLVTPPTLILPMPSPLSTSAAEASESEVTTEVEYLFAGLEYRNTITAPFEGWTFSYTSIEGGKAGGSRAELHLRPSRSSSGFEAASDDVLNEDEARNFIESGYRLVNELEKTSVAGVDVKDEVSSLLDINAAKYFDITTGAPATGALSSFKYFIEPIQLERLVEEEFEEDEGLEAPASKLIPLEELDLDIDINRDDKITFEEYESSEEVKSENIYPDQDVDDVEDDDVIEDLEAFQRRIAVSSLDKGSQVTAEDSVFAELADAEADAAANSEAFQGTAEEAVFAELKDAEVSQETKVEGSTDSKATDDAVGGKEEGDAKKE